MQVFADISRARYTHPGSFHALTSIPNAPYRSHLREIDFLITRGSKICPIEVKSSRIDRHVSLDEFCAKYSSRILKKYIIHTKDFSKDKDIICTPIYTCPFV